MTIAIGREEPAKAEGAPVSFVSFGSGPAAVNSLAALVARGLTKQNNYDRQGRLYASDAGLCERKAVLAATDTNPSIDTASAQGYYALGNAIEELVMDGLYAQGALLFKQYRLPDVGLNLGGYIDGIILLAGRVRVLEVKSCGKLPDVPKPHHASQAYIYSAVTGLPASLLYFSRTVAKLDGTMLMKEFNLEEHPSEKRKSIYRAVLASLAVKRKVVPEKPSHMDTESKCTDAFCPFTSACWHGAGVDTGWPVISASDNVDLIREAHELTDTLLSSAATIDRRTGVLNYLKLHGNNRAKELLTESDWSTLI